MARGARQGRRRRRRQGRPARIQEIRAERQKFLFMPFFFEMTPKGQPKMAHEASERGLSQAPRSASSVRHSGTAGSQSLQRDLKIPGGPK
eukprot:6991472-Pyramimonas_sp.AAC.1